MGANVILDVDTYPCMWNHRAKEAFSVFGRSRLHSGEIVLVLYHTAAIEGYLNSYVEWAKDARRGPGPSMPTGHVDIEGNMLLKKLRCRSTLTSG